MKSKFVKDRVKHFKCLGQKIGCLSDDYVQWCVHGEASEALASGPIFLGAALRCYARKFSLIVMKNLGYYSLIKCTTKQIICKYSAFKGAPTATAI